MATLGINIYVCLGDTIIAGTRSNEIQTSVDTIEISSPTSGIWKQHKNIRKDWSISTSFLCLANDDVQKLLQVGNTYTIQVVGQEGSAAEVLLSGTAILTNCKITASIANLVQGSFVFDGNGELTSDQPVPPVPQNPELAWSAASATATIGHSNTFPTLSNPHNLAVSYTSSDTSVATVDSSGVVTLVAAGSANISASFAGNEDYYASTVTYALAVEAALPYDAEVEYIGFTGTQKINLNFGIGTSKRVIVDAVSSVATTGSKILVGVASAAANWFGCAGVYWGVGTAVGATSNISATTRMTADITFGTNIITGTVNNVYIERSGTSSTGYFTISFDGYPFKGNVYSCQFYDGNSIICDLVPVRVGQVGYMYDRVSGELFGNDGTGSFTIGPDKN